MAHSLVNKLFFVVSITLLLGSCMSVPAAPAPTQPAAQAPTPAPTSAPPTQASAPTQALTGPPAPEPTLAPAPTTAPTAAPPTATSAPTAAPQSAASYFVYPRPDGSLWRVDGPGQAPINLADPTEPGALLPWAASPDGRTIAIVSGHGIWNPKSIESPSLALWLVSSDGANPRKIQDLLPASGVDQTPGGDAAFNLLPALTGLQRLAWSPDGALVVFASSHEGQVDLYTATLDGAVTRLTETPTLEQGPTWSPDGAKVAYRTTTGFGTGAGWGDVGLAVTARGGGPPLLAIGQEQLSSADAIPELLWIGPDMFVAGLWNGAVGNDTLRAVTVSSGEIVTVFAEPYSALSWSPATSQLAIAGASESVVEYMKDRALSPGLYTWMPGAPEAVRVLAGPVEALVWSAQGDVLAYSMARSGKQPGVGLWSLLMDGDLKHLADAPTQDIRWSPDGQRLAVDKAIYARDGQLLAELLGQSVRPEGWGTQGLFFTSLAADGQTRDLWLWDGQQPQQLDTGLAWAEGAGVVVAK
jgi:Tol biopolymer transport system component